MVGIDYTFKSRDEAIELLDKIGLEVSCGTAIFPKEIPDDWPITKGNNRNGTSDALIVIGHLYGAPRQGAYLYLGNPEKEPVIRAFHKQMHEVFMPSILEKRIFYFP